MEGLAFGSVLAYVYQNNRDFGGGTLKHTMKDIRKKENKRQVSL